MKTETQVIVTKLINLCAWMLKHIRHGDEIVCISADGWGGCEVHVEPSKFFELAGHDGTGWPEADNHRRTVVDGIGIVAVYEEADMAALRERAAAMESMKRERQELGERLDRGSEGMVREVKS